MSPPVEHSAPTELVRGGEALDAYPLHDEEDLRSTGPMPSVPASSSSPSPPPPPPPTPDELAAAAALRAGTPPPTQEELAAAAVQYAETPPPSPTPAAGVDGAPEEIGDEPDADFEDSRWLEAWAEAGFASEWPLGARRHFYGWQAASALVQVTFVVGVVLFAPEPLTRYDLMDDGGLLEERWITSYFVPKKTEEDASAKSEKQRRKKRRDKRTVAQGKKGGEDKGSPGKDKRGGQRRLSRSAKRALERALGLGGAGAGGLPTDLLVGGSVAGAHRFDALARPLGRVGTSTPRGRRARVPGGSILGGRGVRGIGAKDRKAITRGTRDLKPVATRLKVSGSLDRKSIKSTINAKFSRIEHCFERHSRQIKPGRIAFRFTIGVDGTVTGVRATQDKIGYPKLTACLSGVFSAMRFPPPSGGPAEVTYPLVYEQ